MQQLQGQEPNPTSPPCYQNKCKNSIYMMDDFDPYIDLWIRLNSKTTETAGLGNEILKRCEVSDKELELLLLLDQVYNKIKNEEDQKKQQLSKHKTTTQPSRGRRR